MKTGLIIEGGGMKCAYSAAILDAFLKDGIDFDCCIGVSAGAGNAVSYLAGQYGRNLRYYTIHLSDPYYFGLRSFLHCGSFYGLRHIYGDMTNEGGADPLDYDSMMANPTDLLIAATRADSGRTVYFHKEQMKRNDYRMLMASCAIPSVTKPVRIGSEKYVDGGVSDSIPIAKAFRDGCDKVVIILSKPRGFVKEPEAHRLLYTLALLRYPKIVRDLDRRHIMYKECQDTMYAMEKQGKAFLFCPSAPPEMSTYTMDPEIEEQLYQLGLKDYETWKGQLQAFLQD